MSRYFVHKIWRHQLNKNKKKQKVKCSLPKYFSRGFTYIYILLNYDIAILYSDRHEYHISNFNRLNTKNRLVKDCFNIALLIARLHLGRLFSRMIFTNIYNKRIST